MKGFETLLGLLFASALLAALARKARLPVPIVMVLGGVAAAFAPVVRELAIDPDVAFALFVPPLALPRRDETSVPGYAIGPYARARLLLCSPAVKTRPVFDPMMREVHQVPALAIVWEEQEWH